MTRDMTEVYGVGAFLAAGCQIYKMAVDTEADYIKIWPDRKTMQETLMVGLFMQMRMSAMTSGRNTTISMYRKKEQP